MGRRADATLELAAGLVLLVVGGVVYWWARGLYWIATYPEPIEKRVIEALPFAAWLIGAFLLIDLLRRCLIRDRPNQSLSIEGLANSH